MNLMLMSGFAIILHYIASHCITPHYTALHRIRNITLYCTLLCHITSYYTASHRITPYYTLHYTALHCITPYYTLHYTAWDYIALHFSILELTQRLAAREEEVSRLQADIGTADASSAGGCWVVGEWVVWDMGWVKWPQRGHQLL